MLRQNSAVTWSAAEAGRRLYTSEETAAGILARLSADAFVSVEDGLYRYDCRSKEHDHMIGELQKMYAKHLIPITRMIHAKRRREFVDRIEWRNS